MVTPPLVFNCIMYWLAGLNPKGDRFVIGTLVMMLMAMGAGSLGFVVGSITSGEGAAALGPALNIICALFAGFFMYVFEQYIPILISVRITDSFFVSCMNVVQ